MSLADRTPEPKRRGGVCSVGALFDQIPEDDATTLRRWMADRSMDGSAILQSLKDEYNSDDPDVANLVTFGYSPVRRHRAGDCKCDQ